MDECLRRSRDASGRCDEWRAGGANGSYLPRATAVEAALAAKQLPARAWDRGQGRSYKKITSLR